MFQEIAKDIVFQHYEVHFQHGDYDEGESKHTFLISTSTGHVAIYGEKSNWERASSRQVHVKFTF